MKTIQIRYEIKENDYLFVAVRNAGQMQETFGTFHDSLSASNWIMGVMQKRFDDLKKSLDTQDELR